MRRLGGGARTVDATRRSAAFTKKGGTDGAPGTCCGACVTSSSATLRIRVERGRCPGVRGGGGFGGGWGSVPWTRLLEAGKGRVEHHARNSRVPCGLKDRAHGAHAAHRQTDRR